MSNNHGSSALSAIIGLLAWTSLHGLMLFMATNVAGLTAGSGYFSLAVSVGAGAAALYLLPGASDVLAVRRSAFLLMAFFAWCLVRAVLDYGQWEPIKALTLGTSGGMAFALGTGIIAGLMVQTLLRFKGHWVTAPVFLIAFYLVSTFHAVNALTEHLQSVRETLFLLAASENLYQRAGDLIIMSTLVASALLLLSRDAGPLTRLALALTYLGFVAALLPLSQIVGSNAGFVVTVALALATVLWTLLSTSRTWRRNAPQWSLRFSTPIVVARLTPIALVHVAWITVVAVTCIAWALDRTGLETAHFRIFGFGQDGIGGVSLTARMQLIAQNFVDQLAVAPVFGNLNADTLVSGVGTYAHSLLSVASHLGLVGAAMLVGYGVWAHREFQSGGEQGVLEWDSIDIKMLRFLCFANILGFALIAAFFTWMPLWFAIGLFLTPVVLRHHPVAFINARGEHATAYPAGRNNR